jgi:hypothetical protein
LDDHQRDSALVYYRLAYRLYGNPDYLKAIHQLEDTIHP